MSINKENKIAMVLFVIGIVYIFLGFVLGVALGTENTFGGYEASPQLWSVTFAWWTGGFVAGMSFIGFSEIIELLHQANKLKRKELISLNILDQSPVIASEVVVSKGTRQLSKNDEEMIYELYEKKKMKAERIIITPFEDFFLVKVNGKFDLFEVGSFIPEMKDINQYTDIKKWFEDNKHKW